MLLRKLVLQCSNGMGSNPIDVRTKKFIFWLNVQTFMVKAHFTLLHTGRCDAVALVFCFVVFYDHRAPDCSG